MGAWGQVPKVEVFGENFISRPDPGKKRASDEFGCSFFIGSIAYAYSVQF